MAEEEPPLYAAAVYFPIVTGLVVILDIPPLLWHIRNRNLAAAALVAWIITYNFFAFTNALIWRDNNVHSWFPGYILCDVEVYVAVAGWTGISTSLLCIMRGLAKVLDTKNQVVTRASSFRQHLVDATICWAPAIIQLGVFDIVKVYRYYIYDISGCVPSLDTSWVSVALVYIWPVAADIIVAYYAVLVLVRLHRYRAEFSRLVHSHNTTRSRFLRLFGLAMLILCAILPAQSTLTYLNIAQRSTGFSWSRNHDPAQRSRIQAVLTDGQPYIDRWIALVCGFLLFLFFGLGTDASEMYRAWAKKLNPARLFRKKPTNRPRRPVLCYSHGNDAPISPSSRSTFTCKTYFSSFSPTATDRSDSTAGKSTPFSKSLGKLPLDFWRSKPDPNAASPTTTSSGGGGGRAGSIVPLLPLHRPLHRQRRENDDDAAAAANGNAINVTVPPAAARAPPPPPTIDTAISMTPLSSAIRKCSVGTLIEDENDDGAATLCGSPTAADVEKYGGGCGAGDDGSRRGAGRGRVDGLGIDLGGVVPRMEV